MLAKPVITLTTDFGLKDPFVGIMKGVILKINPDVQIVDISHDISPHNVFEASQVISMSYKYFSPTTIHVVVVDPGVGGLRRPLLIASEDHFFIGPDNGVFTPVLEESQNHFFKVLHISASHYYLPQMGPTFHGRDIFAPVAAWLSRGIDSSKLGTQINDYVTFSIPKSKATNNNTFEGKIVHIDTFGNAITNITKDNLDILCRENSKKRLNVVYKNKQLNISNYYAETEGSDLSVLLNSFGFLELFIYKQNAADKFGIKIGDKVSVMVV